MGQDTETDGWGLSSVTEELLMPWTGRLRGAWEAEAGRALCGPGLWGYIVRPVFEKTSCSIRIGLFLNCLFYFIRLSDASVPFWPFTILL